MLVALKEELRELCAVLGEPASWRNETYGGEDYLFLVPGVGGQSCRVMVFVMGDMGPAASTHGADRLLASRPAVIVSLGIACSLDAKDLRLGDVIVANQIDGYDEKGKAVSRGARWVLKRGGEVYRATDDITRLADQLEFGASEVFRKWQGECERDLLEQVGEGTQDRVEIDRLVGERQLRFQPHILKAHLASGVSVAAAAQFRDWVLERDRNIKALEMEAVGVLRAAHERRVPVPTLVLRGISDLGDGDKKVLDAIGDGALRRAAMRNATRLLWALMKTGRLPQAEDGRAQPVVHPTSSPSKGSALPRMEHAFIGRKDEVTRLREALLSNPPLPAVVLGPGGFGKSTIAMQVLHDERLKAVFGARRYFVRLDAATSMLAAAELIARQIGVTVTKDPVAEIVARLESERAVLVLDNYETIWAAAGSGKLVEKLADVEGLALVVTVRGLVVPPGVPGRCKIEVKQLSLEESVELFTAISGYSDGPELRRLLAELDGVPLAIQLLAHAAAPGGLSLLVADWKRRKTAVLARDGAHDDREWSWKASLDVSWGSPLMTDAARRAASVLAVLPDGLAARDFDAVLPADGPGAASLLVRMGLAYLEELRLRMLAPVREHLVVHHRPSTDDHRRAAEHYRELAKTLGPKPGWPGGLEATQRLAPEVANLDTMIRHGLAESEPGQWIEAAASLCNFARRTGLWEPNPIHHAAERAEEVGDVAGQVTCVWSLAEIASAQSKHERARGLYEQAWALYEKTDDVLGQARCIERLGDIAFARSDDEQAQKLCEQAQVLYEQVGFVLGQANCIKNKGDIALTRREQEQARVLYEQAQPLYESIGDVLGQAGCIRSMGDIALHRSEHEKAKVLYEQALSLYERVGDVQGQASCMESIGDIALRYSEHEKARVFYEQALPLYKRVGNVQGQANCIRSMGDIAFECSEHEKARVLYEQALAAYASIREPFSMGRAHVGLAHVARSPAERAIHVAEARRLWVPLDMPRLLLLLDTEFGPADSPP